MLVKPELLKSVLEKLKKPGEYGLDTETTGLHWWKHRLFSIIINDGDESYYFDFTETLSRECLNDFQVVFSEPGSTWYIHNAKFDLHMLANEGLFIGGQVHCTEIGARIEYNDHIIYNLAKCAERINLEKSNAVEEWISKNKAFSWVSIPGKQKRAKDKHFEQVPLEIMSGYGEKDGELTRILGHHQEAQIDMLNKSGPKEAPDLFNILNLEKRLIKTCFSIERAGIKIDRAYVNKALAHEFEEKDKAISEFMELTGREFKDSAKVLKEVFDEHGLEYGLTAKGNASFKDDVLEKINHPITKTIQSIRSHDKFAGTYYSSFLYFADHNDFIHANMRQAGTSTGRFSYSDPNLQNVPKQKELDLDYYVRKVFIPDNDAYLLVPMDYDAQEFRMMIDYAGELGLIERINGGYDPHQGVADMMGVERDPAKTLNFGLLYGMGIDKLAKALGKTTQEARELKELYFAKLPRVQRLMWRCQRQAKSRGYLFNWLGRRLNFPDPNYAYKGLNGVIQGGCGDTIKTAMNNIDSFLEPHKTRILVQVHDELLLGVHKKELHLLPEIKALMENVYIPKNGLNLTVSMDHSFTSWGTPDKISGPPPGAF